MSTATPARVTAEEYLAFERASEMKHELRDGEIVAMPGGTENHNLIALNAATQFVIAFRGRPCRAYGSDMRIKIVATGRYAYPDVSALCGQPEFEDDVKDVLLNPALLVEVLSPSTESYDRGEKFEHYRQIPSLGDYVLMAQHRVYAEHYIRQADDSWTLREYKAMKDVIRIGALDCSLRLADVYDKVEF